MATIAVQQIKENWCVMNDAGMLMIWKKKKNETLLTTDCVYNIVIDI